MDVLGLDQELTDIYNTLYAKGSNIELDDKYHSNREDVYNEILDG